MAVGVGLCVTGVGSGLGATILIGAATSGVFSAGTQYITTGKIDPKSLAADIAIGGATAPIGGGVESAVGSALSRTGLCQAGRNILTGAAAGAVEGGVSDGLSYLAGPGPHTVGGLASSVGGGAVGGGLTGGATAKITNHMQGLTGWACFTADTPVVMADGSTRPIARVEVGDRVLAHNPHTGADEVREVLDAPVHEDAATWRVTTDDGGTVTTTPTHRFWVQGAGWTKAQDLVPGDRLRTTANPTENPHTNNDGATVVESQPTGQASTVHNLTIHGLANYYITTTTGTRALVHNEYHTGPAAPGSEPYHYAYEAVLDQVDLGRSRRVHFNRSNAQLEEALRADPDFAAAMDQVSPGILGRVSSGGGRRNPLNFTWHHEPTSNVGGTPGVMRLVPREEHTPGSDFWKSLHPDGYGGYAEWATPNGARPNR